MLDAITPAVAGMRLEELLVANDVAGLRGLFQSFFAGIPYQWFTNNQIANYEGYYASVFYSYFAALGFDCRVEAAPVVYAAQAKGPNAWDAFIQTVNQARGPVTSQDLSYAQAMPPPAQYQQAQIPMPAGRVNFGRPVPQAPGGNRIAAMKNFVDMADWGHFVA